MKIVKVKSWLILHKKIIGPIISLKDELINISPNLTDLELDVKLKYLIKGYEGVASNLESLINKCESKLDAIDIEKFEDEDNFEVPEYLTLDEEAGGINEQHALIFKYHNYIVKQLYKFMPIFEFLD